MASPSASQSQIVLLGYLLALFLSVCTCAVYAFWQAQRQAEFAQASDYFGYLQTAQDIRRGTAPHGLPKFTLDSPHARLTLDFLRAQHVPVDNTSLAGPNGYHYVAATNQFICQYPPGTGWMLSLFPEGAAVRAWRMLATGVLVAFAAWACWCGWRKRTLASLLAVGLISIASCLGILYQGLTVSYSIDLLCVPLLVAVVAAFAASHGGTKGAAAAGMAGAAVGWAMVIRLAAAFFVPGFMVLAVIPGLNRRTGKLPTLARAGAFFVGLLLAGAVPLMLHQLPLTGSMFRSTYTPTDASPPSAGAIGANADYYFAGSGSDFVYRWGAGTTAFVLALTALGVRGRTLRVVGAALCALVPTVYFLTHPITTPYYQLPTIFVSLACFGMVFIQPREDAPAAPRILPAKILAPALAGMALAAIASVGSAAFLPRLDDPDLARMRDVRLPEGPNHDHPLENPNAWIIGDRLAGSLWYYHGIVAQSIVPMPPPLRAAFLDFIRARHEPLYIINDNPAMLALGSDLIKSGHTFTEIGTFCGYPGDTASKFVTVYRVEFP